MSIKDQQTHQTSSCWEPSIYVICISPVGMHYIWLLIYIFTSCSMISTVKLNTIIKRCFYSFLFVFVFPKQNSHCHHGLPVVQGRPFDACLIYFICLFVHSGGRYILCFGLVFFVFCAICCHFLWIILFNCLFGII